MDALKQSLKGKGAAKAATRTPSARKTTRGPARRRKAG
jgi:hypothetical protein